MPTRRAFLLSLSLPLLLPACRGLRGGDIDPKLQDRLRLYEGVVRWGGLDRTYGFLKPELAETTPIPGDLGNIRVTNYEEVSGPAAITEDRWAQTVVIEYVLQDRQVVKTLIDSQVWEREPDGDVWYRSNPIPVFQ